MLKPLTVVWNFGGEDSLRYRHILPKHLWSLIFKARVEDYMTWTKADIDGFISDINVQELYEEGDGFMNSDSEHEDVNGDFLEGVI